MTVLALAALLFSVSTAERISTFANPPAGNPDIVTIFRTVVQRTLDAPSFNYNQYLNYQAPDRTATQRTFGSMEVIGKEAYIPLTPDVALGKWGRGPLTPLVDSYYGPAMALRGLRTLLTSNSVIREGNNFIMKQVVSADSVSPGNPGQVLVTYMVYVNDDYVTAIQTHVEGWWSIPYARTHGILRFRRVDTYTASQVTYSSFGQIAPITAPPAARTVQLTSCGQVYHLPYLGREVCSAG